MVLFGLKTFLYAFLTLLSSVGISSPIEPIVPYKGSAIFLHCMTGEYTAGCVAVPENDMLIILNLLDTELNAARCK